MTERRAGAEDLKARVRLDAVTLFLSHWRGSLVAVSLVTLAVLFAWRDHMSTRGQLLWGGVAIGNYLAQALVLWRLEAAATLREGILRYMPALLLSIAVSGMVWGTLPWLLQPAPAPVMLFASLFNAMMIFCVVNAPATPAMQACAVVPVTLANTAALIGYESLPTYSAAAFAGLCGLILLYGLRVQAAIRGAMAERHVAQDLARELERQQARMMGMERERTLLLERQRLMRDMHDGLGSTLAASLALAETGQATSDVIAMALRECMDDMRMVVDSLEPLDNDLVALLATLRFRMGRRLEQAGVRLDWDMQDLPPLAWLGPPEALQVMRIVQEALANLVRHAGARRAQVAVELAGDRVEVRIADDGSGFDAAHVRRGRGLDSMARRAAALCGSLEMCSAPGEGTRVCLALPLVR